MVKIRVLWVFDIVSPNDEGISLLKKDQDIIEGIRNDGKIDDKKGSEFNCSFIQKIFLLA